MTLPSFPNVDFFGGIGGGVTRDLLLNEIPSPFKDPIYPLVCVAMGFLGLAIYRYADSREEWFRTSGIVGAIVIGLIATTAGAVVIDLFSGVTPEIVRPSQHLVTTAILAATVYSLIAVAEGHSVLSSNADLSAGCLRVSYVCRPGALAADCATQRARRRPEYSRLKVSNITFGQLS